MEVKIKNSRSAVAGVVFQPSRLVEVPFPGTAFSMGNSGFLVKVDSIEPVTLTVKYIDDDIWVTTSFFPGWNPDWIKLIDTSVQVPAGTLIKAGF